MQIIIVSPSLDPTKNISGISSVTSFIIENNPRHQYIHFELGRKDGEKGGIYRVGAILRKYKEWKSFLRKHPQALVHYNFPLEKPSILRDTPFMHFALRNGHKMVVHIHGGVFLTSPKIPFPFFQILKYVFSWKVPFITLSEKEMETVKDRFHAKNVITLSNCISLKEAKAYCRKECDRSLPLTLGYLGRITEEKGMTYLLNACIMLKEQGIPFHLKLAGAEEHNRQFLSQFNNRLGSSFEYCGLVSGERKTHFLQSLDLLVMPSFFEGLPMSLLECMSFGVVPIVTPVGSIPTVVTDKQNGIFIKVKDSESIVNAVEYLHNNRDVLLKMSQISRSFVFEHFNPVKYVNNLNEIYEHYA